MTPVLLIDFWQYIHQGHCHRLRPRASPGYRRLLHHGGDGCDGGPRQCPGPAGSKAGPLTFAHRYAYPSAAGGLRMMASGLVPELMARPPGEASLGPEPRSLKTYSLPADRGRRRGNCRLKPDIFLLVGGTDGGNTECILHNAQVLAEVGESSPLSWPERTASRQCQRFSKAGRFICAKTSCAQVRRAEHNPPGAPRGGFPPPHCQGQGPFQNRLPPVRYPHAHTLGGDAGHGAAVLRLPGRRPASATFLAVDVGGATTDVLYSVSEGHPPRSTPSARVFRALCEADGGG